MESRPKPKSKKKASQNAFYFFMLDYRKREEAKGRHFNNLCEVSSAAGCEWQRFTPTDKKPYEMKAQACKNKASNTKYTSLGEAINIVINREEEEENKRREMENYIEKLIQNNITGDAFTDLTFYVGHINYYCEVPSQDKYYPAEIAIVRFNLRNGVDPQDVYNIIINAGNIVNGQMGRELPIGYHLAAKTLAEETHQIPPPPHNPEMGSETDIKKCFKELLEFLRVNLDPKDPLPPIYVDHLNEKVVKNVFSWMPLEFGYDEDLIKVYSLPYLFFCLRNAAHLKVANEQAFISKSIAINELERDVYDYVKGICCPYHCVSDAYPHCSLSKAVRSVYIICDYCCEDANIDVKPGYHVPMNSDPKRLQRRPASRVTVSSTDDWGDLSRPNSSMAQNVSRPPSVSSQDSRNKKVTGGGRMPVSSSRILDQVLDDDDYSPWNTNPSQPPNTTELNQSDFPSLGGLSISNAPRGRRGQPAARNGSASNGFSSSNAWGGGASSAGSSTTRAVGRGRGRILQSSNDGQIGNH